MQVALMLHVLAAVIWVGGLFFAYALLRPVLGAVDLTAPQRLTIWAHILKKFFPWVWLCILILLTSGFYMIYLLGGFGAVGFYVYAMTGIAVVMIAVFKFVCVAPFRHLLRGVEERKWEVAAYALGTIRKLVAVNLALGIAVIVAATAFKG